MKPSRVQLEQNVIAAVLDLFGETGTDAFAVQIPNTTPPLFIAAGESGVIRHLIDVKEKAQIVEAPNQPPRLLREAWINEFVSAALDVRPDIGSKFGRAVALNEWAQHKDMKPADAAKQWANETNRR